MSWSKEGNFSGDHDDNYNVISRDLHIILKMNITINDDHDEGDGGSLT